MDDRIGAYKTKPFSKDRQNIVLILNESWRKHSIHALVEVDVTKAREIISNYKEKGERISFTGWIIKCIAQAISEQKELNACRWRKKIVIFDDVDVAIPVERYVGKEARVMAYIIRKANEKSVREITDEIRKAQGEDVNELTQVLGKKLTRLEKFAINAPLFIKKILLWVVRKHGILKKKHMGTVGVTAVGMMGKFPGWLLPLGGVTTILVALGGINKKPGVIDDEIKIREYLSMTITVDHDLIDGAPLARFVSRLTDLIENAFGLNHH